MKNGVLGNNEPCCITRESNGEQRSCYATRLTWRGEMLTLAISAKGASSPRKGPCPPYVQFRRLRTFFQPDSGGLQAQLGKEGA